MQRTAEDTVDSDTERLCPFCSLSIEKNEISVHIRAHLIAIIPVNDSQSEPLISLKRRTDFARKLYELILNEIKVVALKKNEPKTENHVNEATIVNEKNYEHSLEFSQYCRNGQENGQDSSINKRKRKFGRKLRKSSSKVAKKSSQPSTAKRIECFACERSYIKLGPALVFDHVFRDMGRTLGLQFLCIHCTKNPTCAKNIDRIGKMLPIFTNPLNHCDRNHDRNANTVKIEN